MPVDTDAEILGLRTVLRDLVALSAFPAALVGRDPPAVAGGLADALIGLLQLDFAFVRLCDPGGAGAVDVTRGSAWKTFPEWLERHLATGGRLSAKGIILDIDGGVEPCRGVVIPIGVDADGGVVAAACDRADFPTETDQLLLSLAANHAATAFQSARVIQERTSAEEELRKVRDVLEVKVAERTGELARLADEQAALRRVATLVASGVSPPDVFAAVAREVGLLLGVDATHMARYDRDGMATGVASWSTGHHIPVGARSTMEGESVSALVLRTGRPARMDSYEDASGSGAAMGRELGLRSSVGAPIVVEGRLWGVMIASSKDEQPLAADTESRIAAFTELVATAISNTEARVEVGRLAEEQAALRRVATLVAQGVPPSDLFGAVAEEVGRLLGADLAGMVCYETDNTVTAVATWSAIGDHAEVRGRWTLDGDDLGVTISRTGRPARIDDYDALPGRIAAFVRDDLGVRSSVGSPIVVEGRLWGALFVHSTHAEPLPVDTESRLLNFTELVATAMSNIQARSDLAASRARIVAATDEERRRLVRDLHDGAQQRLVHTVITLKLALRALEEEKQDASALLGEALQQAERATAEVRELAHGILPNVLTQGGLHAGVEALASRMAVPVENGVTVGRLPAAVEATAYFVVAEALTNVSKHARAERAAVMARVEDGTLRVDVRDDGAGGARPDGSGLLGLGDRLAVLGGRLRVESPADGGTLVAAAIPLPG